MRAWVEVDLDAVEHNIREVRRVTDPHAKVLAVVKADAYGHGYLETARTLVGNGADFLGVATFDEAKQLRTHGISAPILILGPAIVDNLYDIVAYDVIPTVFDMDTAIRISEAARTLGRQATIHIKLDTGMTRVGYRVYGDLEKDAAVIEEILQIAALPGIAVGGIFTHFSKADEEDRSFTDEQFRRFVSVTDELDARELHIPIRHCCNSAGIIDFPAYHLDMVRSGLITYGHYPSDTVNHQAIDLRPAMQFKTVVTNLNRVEAGTAVSYGGTFVAERDMLVATIAIGYADGYSRTLSRRAQVLVGGRRAPVIGNICMDQCMIDVTHVKNINVGDEVILFGKDGNDSITVEAVAALMGTINYEVLCVIGKRIPRVYIQNGQFVSVLNYLV